MRNGWLPRNWPVQGTGQNGSLKKKLMKRVSLSCKWEMISQMPRQTVRADGAEPVLARVSSCLIFRHTWKLGRLNFSESLHPAGVFLCLIFVLYLSLETSNSFWICYIVFSNNYTQHLFEVYKTCSHVTRSFDNLSFPFLTEKETEVPRSYVSNPHVA